MTDMTYHRLAAVEDRDPGLTESTHRPGDAGRFRTPSLRNVGLTGPWWHDGRSATLVDAVRRHPAPPPQSDEDALVAFLETFSDHAFLVDPALARPDRACGKRL